MCKLISKAQKNPKFIKELFDRDNINVHKKYAVDKVLNDMNEKDIFIDSCKSVGEIINQNNVHVFKPYEIREIMKDLGYKYKKVNHIAMSANSERSLVLR